MWSKQGRASTILAILASVLLCFIVWRAQVATRGHAANEECCRVLDLREDGIVTVTRRASRGDRSRHDSAQTLQGPLANLNAWSGTEIGRRESMLLDLAKRTCGTCEVTRGGAIRVTVFDRGTWEQSDLGEALRARRVRNRYKVPLEEDAGRSMKDTRGALTTEGGQ